MNKFTKNIIGYIGIIGSIMLFAIYFKYKWIFLLILGVVIIVVSVFYLVIIASYDIFRKDKVLDVETLIKQGLTIVQCHECDRDNVLEDKYCIHCGAKLGDYNE